jgi:outer membrane lipoprotein SlyB
MTKDNFRTIGAVIGLVLGLAMMIGLGFSSMVAGFLFGAGGAVAGGISGEKLHARRRRGS